MQVKIKLNVPMLGFKIGKILNIECDDNGVPCQLFWRKRFQDYLKDNCLEIIDNKRNLSHNKIKVENLNNSENFSNKE